MVDNSIKSVTDRRLRAWVRAVKNDVIVMTNNPTADQMQKSHDRVVKTESHLIDLGVKSSAMVKAAYEVIGSRAENYV